ncbi:MAG: hypothetical protein U1D97_02135, partial [Desulfuromonadales bacterium]|nr:hypothetical protein [Desulfuromonadales bacterium]
MIKRRTGVRCEAAFILAAFAGLLWLLSLTQATPAAAQATFVGSDKCAACHQAEFDNWRATGHPAKLRTAKEARE